MRKNHPHRQCPVSEIIDKLLTSICHPDPCPTLVRRGDEGRGLRFSGIRFAHDLHSYASNFQDAIASVLELKFASSSICHPDRSAAEWRDLRFQLFNT